MAIKKKLIFQKISSHTSWVSYEFLNGLLSAAVWGSIMAGQPTPAWRTPPRNKALLRAY